MKTHLPEVINTILSNAESSVINLAHIDLVAVLKNTDGIKKRT